MSAAPDLLRCRSKAEDQEVKMVAEGGGRSLGSPVDDYAGRAAFSGFVAILHALKRNGTLAESEVDSIGISVLLNFGRTADPHPDATMIREALRPLLRESAIEDAEI